ncbi:hypothetical protein BC831DRAFT_463503 [Entophlyctis helioformis]|nr:hypothetical protein BC831DRAFT_463503 [Entophlyctis helioformis]
MGLRQSDAEAAARAAPPASSVAHCHHACERVGEQVLPLALPLASAADTRRRLRYVLSCSDCNAGIWICSNCLTFNAASDPTSVSEDEQQQPDHSDRRARIRQRLRGHASHCSHCGLLYISRRSSLARVVASDADDDGDDDGHDDGDDDGHDDGHDSTSYPGIRVAMARHQQGDTLYGARLDMLCAQLQERVTAASAKQPEPVISNVAVVDAANNAATGRDLKRKHSDIQTESRPASACGDDAGSSALAPTRSKNAIKRYKKKLKARERQARLAEQAGHDRDPVDNPHNTDVGHFLVLLQEAQQQRSLVKDKVDVVETRRFNGRSRSLSDQDKATLDSFNRSKKSSNTTSQDQTTTKRTAIKQSLFPSTATLHQTVAGYTAALSRLASTPADKRIHVFMGSLAHKPCLDLAQRCEYLVHKLASTNAEMRGLLVDILDKTEQGQLDGVDDLCRQFVALRHLYVYTFSLMSL